MFKQIVTIASVCVIFATGYFGAKEFREYQAREAFKAAILAEEEAEKQREIAEKEAERAALWARLEADKVTEEKRKAIVSFMISEGSNSYESIVEYVSHWCVDSIKLELGSKIAINVTVAKLLKESGHNVDYLGTDRSNDYGSGGAGWSNSPQNICVDQVPSNKQ